jgi:hypothetical protein
MSISSITSSPLPNSSLVVNSPPETNIDVTSPPLSYKHNSRSPNSPNLSYPMSIPNSPDSPSFHHNSTAKQQQQQRRHMPYQIDQHYQNRHYPYQQRHINAASTSHYPVDLRNSNANPYGYYCTTRASSISSATCATSPQLTLQERRQRNKTASAKYRAKKNQQHDEMRMLISSLTKENDLLQRQLDHLKRDNDKLKVTCDKLRGKMMAEKMLKKLLHNEQQQKKDLQEFVDEDDDNENDESDDEDSYHKSIMNYPKTNSQLHLYNNEDTDDSYYSSNSRPQPQSNSAFISNDSNRFDEDINFEDEEEENNSYNNQPNYTNNDQI